MRSFFRHFRSFLLPAMMLFGLPALIIAAEKRGRPLLAASAWQRAAGGLLMLGGFALLVGVIAHFLRRGQGTVMPWDPPTRFIASGPYRYVRNPMIACVILVLLAEAVLFASRGVAWLAAAFFAINTLYFHFSEEPALETRFGQPYRDYKRHVRMWLPRVRPWNG